MRSVRLDLDRSEAELRCPGVTVGVGVDGVILWSASGGMRCIFVRRSAGSPFEITILRGDSVVTQVAFEHDEDAATFAIAEMRAAQGTVKALGSGRVPAVSGP